MTFKANLGTLMERASWIAWILLALSIPFTSSPTVAQFLGETSVTPLAIIPAGVLIFVCLLPYSVRNGRWPRATAPLWLFAIVALIAGLLINTRSVAGYSSGNVLKSSITGYLSLGVGLIYYFSTIRVIHSSQRVRIGLRILYLSLLITLVWATIQATYVLSDGRRVPLILNNIHHLFSVRDLIYNRVVGWAYEPSWLGNQLVILYIPLLLGSILAKESVFPMLRKGLSYEAILLAWSIFILGLTQSRISYLSLFLTLSTLLIVLIWRRIRRRSQSGLILSGDRGRLMQGIILALVVLGIVLALIGMLVFISKNDKRMGRLFSIVDQIPEFRALYLDEGIYAFANRLAFAERLVYWGTGYKVFEQNPILGVGLGNTGFFFAPNLAGYAYRLDEIRAAIGLDSSGLPNPKNIWIRLLAETGLVGFSVFIVWLMVVGLEAFSQFRHGTRIHRVIGLSSLIALSALLVEGFSMDTFALPQFWILPALVTATAWKRDQEALV